MLNQEKDGAKMVAGRLDALYALKCFMFCSNDCFSAENADFTLEGIVCSGEFRIHNSKVVGSIPPPATNKINNLRRLPHRTWEFESHAHVLNYVVPRIKGM